MRIEVVESFTIAKAAGRLNEDVIAFTANFAAVIDGSTTPAARSDTGLTGGRIAAQAVATTLERLSPDADLGEFLDASARAITEAADAAGIPSESPSATAAVVSAARQEAWMIGDVHCSLRPHPGHTAVDQHAISMRVETLLAAIAAGADPESLRRDDPGRRAIASLLRTQVIHRNALDDRLGYTALSATPPPVEMCAVLMVPVDCGEIILASDGYPQVATTLAESERLLAKDIAADPLRVGAHPATKAVAPGANSFDDRAYLRIRVR